ncbi:MAG: hypothetical protein ISN64_01965 [Rickettsia sp.]|nr:hypothetical protein [Rickettsia sp.]
MFFLKYIFLIFLSFYFFVSCASQSNLQNKVIEEYLIEMQKEENQDLITPPHFKSS